MRYAQIEHHYLGLSTELPSGDFDSILQSDNDFHGFGPTVSISRSRPLGQSGLTFDLGGRGSLLFGDADTSYTRFTPPGEPDQIRQDNKLTIIPAGEVQVGLGYNFAWGCRKVSIGGGFEGQFWLNGGTPIIASQDSNTDSDRFTNAFSEDLGFLGGYFQFSIDY